MNPGSGIELSASGIEGSVKITLDTRLGAEQISPAPEIPMAPRVKRKRPIRDAADEAAETMDTTKDAIKALRPQIEAAIIKFCSLTDHTHSMLVDTRPLVLATLESGKNTAECWAATSAKANALIDEATAAIREIRQVTGGLAKLIKRFF